MEKHKYVKPYGSFINENLQNEGLSEFGKKAADFIKGAFRKNGGDFLRNLKLQNAGKISKMGKAGTLPNGVTLYPSREDILLLQSKEKNQIDESKNTVDVDEEVVPLDFPNVKAGMVNVGNDRLIRMVNRVISYPDERPLMIWGAPGIGKTSIIKMVQQKLGIRMIDVQLTTYAPEDFFLPEVQNKQGHELSGRRATRVPQEWLPVYHKSEGEAGNSRVNGPDGKGGIIFLDELSRAKEAIRNICLKLVLEKEMDGGWILGSNWTIIAASNRMEDDETNTAEFGSALGNRFQQVNYSPSVNDFSKYALGAKTKEGEDLFDTKIISFLNWTKGRDFFHKYDPTISGTIFPSPRSWEAAAIAFKNLKKDARENHYTLTNDIIEDEAIAPSVGREAASMFMGYYELSKKVDLDKVGLVYTDPSNAPLPPKANSGGFELDASYILAAAIAYENRGKQLSDQEITNVFDYVVRLANPITAIQVLTAIKEIHPNIFNNTKNPVVLNGLRKFLMAYPGSERELKAANIDV
jgi:hypothetical protein